MRLLEDQESWGKVIGANLIQLKSIVPLVPFLCFSKKDNAHKNNLADYVKEVFCEINVNAISS